MPQGWRPTTRTSTHLHKDSLAMSHSCPSALHAGCPVPQPYMQLALPLSPACSLPSPSALHAACPPHTPGDEAARVSHHRPPESKACVEQFSFLYNLFSASVDTSRDQRRRHIYNSRPPGIKKVQTTSHLKGV